MVDSIVMIGLAIILSYLLGSIPFAYIYGKMRGVDIRKVGSGNPGATNVMRVFGTGPGVLVMLIDAAKGFVAAYFLVKVTPYPNADALKVICGVAAVLGHTFTVFLKFKGGKGVATTAGLFAALAPFSMLITFGTFVTVVVATRYISAASIVAALLLPLMIWVMGEGGQHYIIISMAILLSIVIVMRHRSNISRILNGTENKFGQRVSVKKEEGQS